jgi:glycosyltransferase involved in cell wall biosynthesis
MHVAIASHHALPVRGYGGTQRVVTALVRGLAELGHQVSLLAPAGTVMPEATVVPVPRERFRDPSPELARHVPDGAELLHTHFAVWRPPDTLPVLQTLHGNLRRDVAVPPHTVFVSGDHARRHGAAAFVYNGLDPAEFTWRPVKQDYDLFLGRLHQIKGYRWAVAGARRSGRRLLIAGGWRPSFSRRIKYVGAVDSRRRVARLADARCLWMPALWDEPFGLTIIEALFSGTPVLGTRRGALPEILTPEVGAMSDTLDDMIAAAETIATRSPEACRAHATRHFSHRRMAEGYLGVYRHFLETGSLPPGHPTPFAP